MKPEILPMIRDASRLLVLDIEATTMSRAKRNQLEKKKQPCRKKRIRDQLWPAGKWWRYIQVHDSDSLPMSQSPDRDLAILSAWKNLGHVEEWDADTLADILYLLIETPFVECFCSEPLRFDTYAKMDICPWLGDRAAIGKILRHLSPFWKEAVDQLLREKRISRSTFLCLSNHAPTAEKCCDPYALVHFGHATDVEDLSWKETEVRSSFPLFRGGTLRQLRQAMEVVDTILLFDPIAPTHLLRFLVRSDAKTSAAWVRLSQFFRKPHHRAHFFERLGHAKAKFHAPGKECDRLVQQIAKRATAHNRDALELANLFLVVEKKFDARVLFDMFELSTAITRSDAWIEIPEKVSGRPELKPLIELGRFLVNEDGNCRQQAYGSASNRILRLWEASLQFAPLRKVISDQVWDQFPESLASNLLNLILQIYRVTSSPAQFCEVLDHNLNQIHRQPGEKQAIRLQAALRYLNWLNRFTSLRLQGSFDRFANTVAEGFDTFPNNAAELYLEMIRRPHPNQRWAVEGLSRSAIKQMEQAARSYRAESQITVAIPPFFQALPDVDFSIFFRQPRQFLKLLSKLGTVVESERFDVVSPLNYHPALQVDPRRIDISEACFLFDTILTEYLSDPVPTKLRDYACGRIDLRDEVKAHYRSEFASGLATLWIQIISSALDRHLAASRNPNLDAHTMEFKTRLGKSNKRGFKRFLRALECGDSGYRDRHPSNQLWLKKHAHLHLENWVSAKTPAFPVELPRVDSAAIQLEHDPQEELKMGTYVDSCLAIGGCNQHSAVANTLDINKRIAYLRDQNGRVLARQLLAISEEEELIPFEVYRTQNKVPTEEFERAFKEYDQHLADKLQLPLRKNEGEYTIRSLVVPEWYDDYAWDVDA